MKKIIEVYTGEQGLGQLGLVRAEGDHFVSLKPKTVGPWKTAETLAKAYK